MATPLRTRITVFVAVAAVPTLIAFFVDRTKYPDLHEILIAVGIAIFSVTLLEILFNLAGGNPVEEHIVSLGSEIQRLSKTVDVIEDGRRIGISELHDCTGNYGAQSKWLDAMRGVKQSMDLIGRSLNEWIRAPELDEIIIKKIRSENVTFRWLLMSSENRHLPQLEEDGQRIGEFLAQKIESVVERLTDIRRRLPKDKQHLLEVRVFSNVHLYCSTLRIDNKYFITSYLHTVGSKSSPLIIIEGESSPWALTYGREFNIIWASAKSIFPSDRNDGG
jgi:hypothetical protein